MFSNILGGAAGFPVADLGDAVDQSLRFRGSQTLTRTFSGNCSAVRTVSFWVKRALDEGTAFAAQHFFCVGSLSSVEFDDLSGNFSSGTSAAIGVYDGLAHHFNTGVSYRDPTAWYHVVTQFNGTSTKQWVNGTNLFSKTLTQRVANDITIGAYSGGTFPFKGYAANIHFIDGQALEPTDFGRYQEDGVWVPKNYTGTYGTNGFKLTFDSTQTNGIGHDSSGNGNNFTATGFDTAAISSSNFDNDVDYNDTPTSNWTTLNSVDVSGVGNLSAANLSCGTTSAADTSGIRATQAVSSGKWYFEVKNTVASGTTNIQAGWASTATAQRIDTGDANVYGMPITTNSTHMVALDCDNNAIWTGDDGVWFNSATLSEIEGGDTSNARHTSVSGYPLAPMFLDQAGSFSGTASFNFGQMDFQYTPPAGFSPLHLNNLPEPTIKNGKEYFDVLTWSGTSSSNTITGLDFQPDFVWVKKTDGSESHRLADVIRGSTVGLASNNNLAESDVSGSISSFNSDGITVVNAGQTNESGFNYVAWCWKAGGTAVSNTDGTITSSVSANTTAGFSIVEWQRGTNTTATIGHGLNSAPEFIISKAVVQENWSVYHVGAGNNGRLRLNDNTAFDTSNGSQYWNNTTPSSTVFTVGNGINTNATNDMIAYCWHSVEGFSKFGSYTGNGSDDGPFIYTGFRPAFILTKRSSAAEDWSIVDTTRSISNPAFQNLRPNEPNGEGSGAGSNDIDILSNGFKLRNSTDRFNGTGTYVYACFAENPFGGENAPPVTAR